MYAYDDVRRESSNFILAPSDQIFNAVLADWSSIYIQAGCIEQSQCDDKYSVYFSVSYEKYAINLAQVHQLLPPNSLYQLQFNWYLFFV